MKTELHPRLAALHYLDFTYPGSRRWEDLMKAIAEIVGSPSTSSTVSPQTTSAWIEKGRLFSNQKEYRSALDAFKHAIQLDQNSAVAYAGKSDVFYHLGEY